MFVTHCTACHRRQLIFPSQVTSLAGAGSGIDVHYTCWCGASQTWHAARPVEAEADVSVAA